MQGLAVDAAEADGVASHRRTHALCVVDQLLHDDVRILLNLLVCGWTGERLDGMGMNGNEIRWHGNGNGNENEI